MKKLFTFLSLLFALLGTYQTTAQNFAVKLIADSLQKNANAVVRIDDGSFTVFSATKCIMKTRIVHTILTKDGEERFATKYVGYDNKFIFIRSLNAKIYDANGKKVREYRENDFTDESAIDNGTFHADDRVKYVRLVYPTYPYTIEFSSEIEFKSMLYLQDWYFQNDAKLGVEKSVYQIITLPTLPIRYEELNLSKPATITNTGETISYTWEEKNCKPIEYEPYTKTEQRPFLRLAPQQFELDGHHVDLRTWKDFGEWRKKLCEGRETLPESTKETIRNLVQGMAKEEDKIRKIYEYMQAKTRYVGVQLGIGGFQPFPAEFVDTKGFGDCKALTNYTKALLQAADIPSHYTLVASGKNPRPLRASFPDMQFNHVILCVPLQNKKDTVWLECTSQDNAAGYMGSFTGNRQALLLTDEGGVVAHTPTYTHKENLKNRKITLNLAADGSAKATVHTTYQAMLGETLYGGVNVSKDLQRNYILTSWELPTFELGELKLWNEKQKLPITHEEAEIYCQKLATVSGKRLFVQPNLLSKHTDLPANAAQRKYNVDVEFGYTEQDTVVMNLPENYHMEAKPENISYKTVFGEYETQLNITGNVLTYIRKFVRYRGSFAKEKYGELVEFYKKISKADAAKVVLVNKT